MMGHARTGALWAMLALLHGDVFAQYYPQVRTIGSVQSNGVVVFADGSGRYLKQGQYSLGVTNVTVGGTNYPAVGGTISLPSIAGAAGINGTNGTNGTNGVNGTNGTNGTNGATGPAGTNGSDGAVGPAGPAGTNGADGAVGPMGPAGTNGIVWQDGWPVLSNSLGSATIVATNGLFLGVSPPLSFFDDEFAYLRITNRSIEMNIFNTGTYSFRHGSYEKLSSIGPYSDGWDFHGTYATNLTVRGGTNLFPDIDWDGFLTNEPTASLLATDLENGDFVVASASRWVENSGGGDYVEYIAPTSSANAGGKFLRYTTNAQTEWSGDLATATQGGYADAWHEASNSVVYTSQTSVAIGPSSSAGIKSFVFGSGANAQSYGIAMGESATANTNGIALGSFANAGVGEFVIGLAAGQGEDTASFPGAIYSAGANVTAGAAAGATAVQQIVYDAAITNVDAVTLQGYTPEQLAGASATYFTWGSIAGPFTNPVTRIARLASPEAANAVTTTYSSVTNNQVLPGVSIATNEAPRLLTQGTVHFYSVASRSGNANIRTAMARLVVYEADQTTVVNSFDGDAYELLEEKTTFHSDIPITVDVDLIGRFVVVQTVLVSGWGGETLLLYSQDGNLARVDLPSSSGVFASHSDLEAHATLTGAQDAHGLSNTVAAAAAGATAVQPGVMATSVWTAAQGVNAAGSNGLAQVLANGNDADGLNIVGLYRTEFTKKNMPPAGVIYADNSGFFFISHVSNPPAIKLTPTANLLFGTNGVDNIDFSSGDIDAAYISGVLTNNIGSDFGMTAADVTNGAYGGAAWLAASNSVIPGAAAGATAIQPGVMATSVWTAAQIPTVLTNMLSITAGWFGFSILDQTNALAFVVNSTARTILGITGAPYTSTEFATGRAVGNIGGLTGAVGAITAPWSIITNAPSFVLPGSTQTLHLASGSTVAESSATNSPVNLAQMNAAIAQAIPIDASLYFRWSQTNTVPAGSYKMESTYTIGTTGTNIMVQVTNNQYSAWLVSTGTIERAVTSSDLMSVSWFGRQTASGADAATVTPELYLFDGTNYYYEFPATDGAALGASIGNYRTDIVPTNTQGVVGRDRWAVRFKATSTAAQPDVFLYSGLGYPSHLQVPGASSVAGTGDNLGNHVAVSNLNMAGYAITNAVYRGATNAFPDIAWSWFLTNAPALSGSTGTSGQMAFDSNYFYICVATNVWKRTVLATW